MSEGPTFPFVAVVGMEAAREALLWAAAEPRLGGVLLQGDRGSAKTTLARGLAALLPEGARFVELPIGATEDRVLGSLDLARALSEGRRRLVPGLLAEADGGVLYADEVNLLAEHLVDALLDVAASGVLRVEREGVSEIHPARFVLVGSMNPAEGELRPQLADRFGLAVTVTAGVEPAERVEAVRRRLAFDADPEGFLAAWEAESERLRAQLARARSLLAARVEPGRAVLERAAELALGAGVEGLRADLALVRAASARAALDGRPAPEVVDVDHVAPAVLALRARSAPRPPASSEGRPRQSALGAGAETSSRTGDPVTGDGRRRAGGTGDEAHFGVGVAREAAAAPQGAVAGHGSVGGKGRSSRDIAGAGGVRRGPARPLAELRGRPFDFDVAATVVAGVQRAGPGSVAGIEDARGAERRGRLRELVVVGIDASASMGVEARMEAVKGAVLGVLGDARRRRDRIALVAFGGHGADVVLRPTGSVEVASARLAEVPTGGRTPLGAGIEAMTRLALEARRADRSGASDGYRPRLVLLTDGRATLGEPDPLTAALDAARRVGALGLPATVVDTEVGHPRLRLAAEVARAMDATLVGLDELGEIGLARLLAGETEAGVAEGG